MTMKPMLRLELQLQQLPPRKRPRKVESLMVRVRVDCHICGEFNATQHANSTVCPQCGAKCRMLWEIV